MIQRFKDKRMNAIYNKWVSVTREQVLNLLNRFQAGSNADTAFMQGYKNRGAKPVIGSILYPVYIAGKEWRKVNDKCPDCGKRVSDRGEMKTDWYGWLHYYRCHNCETTFVSQNGGELEIAANR